MLRLFICFILLLVSSRAESFDDPLDRAALLDLYNATSTTAAWLKTGNWTLTNASFCDWFGVTCVCSDPMLGPVVCQVDTVNLAANRLVGTIPDSIGNFQSISSLILSVNRLYSTIPSTLCKLTTLVTLEILGNSLTGSIPACINQMSNLQSLNLDSNQLSGTLPDSIYSIPRLRDLMISHNRLSGTLSEKLALMGRKLESLFLQSNRFEGSLPQALQNLTQLKSFFGSFNQFNSSIPEGIGFMQNLKYLNLQNCRLSGEIPDSFKNLKKLLSLYMMSNQLSGTIPASLGQLPVLGLLDLRENQLSGSIPASITLMSALTLLFLSNNRLNGTLNNSISVPTPQIKISSFLFSSNKFSGTIPMHLIYFVRLKTLDVGRCQLSGTIPNFLGQSMKKLVTLNLAHNQLTSTIPSSLGMLSALENLDLSFNYLTGNIPIEIANFTKLSYFDVSSNQLSGPMLLDFNQLSPNNNFRYFSVANNAFSGSLHRLMKYPFMPGVLNVSNNRFSSDFPAVPFFEIPPPDADPLAAPTVFLVYGLNTIRLIDARGSGNTFDCPIPDYLQSETLFLRSGCRPQYAELQSIFLNYMIGIASAVVFYLIFRGALSRFDSSSSAARQLTQFAAILQYLFLWGIYIFTLYCDQGIFMSMLKYLATTVDNCKPVNTYNAFVSYMPYQPVDAFPVFAETAFAIWTFGLVETFNTVAFWEPNSLISPEILSNIEAFRTLCVDMVASGCGIRQAINADHPEYLTPAYWFASECYLQHPEQAPFGGSGHPTFRAIVIAILTVRCTIELARALLVLAALCLRRVPFADLSVDFIGTSVFAPLLVFAMGADAFRAEVLTYRPTPYDLIRRFVVSSLMCSLSLLAVNCYFFLVVNQKGLDAPSVGSAVMGTLSALSLMVRVCLSFRSELAESKLVDQRRGDQIHVDLADLPSDVGEFAGVLRVGAMVADALHDRSSSAGIVDLNKFEIELAPSLPARDQSSVESSLVGSESVASSDMSTVAERMDAEFLGASVSKSDA